MSRFSTSTTTWILAMVLVAAIGPTPAEAQERRPIVGLQWREMGGDFAFVRSGSASFGVDREASSAFLFGASYGGQYSILGTLRQVLLDDPRLIYGDLIRAELGIMGGYPLTGMYLGKLAGGLQAVYAVSADLDIQVRGGMQLEYLGGPDGGGAAAGTMLGARARHRTMSLDLERTLAGAGSGSRTVIGFRIHPPSGIDFWGAELIRVDGAGDVASMTRLHLVVGRDL